MIDNLILNSEQFLILFFEKSSLHFDDLVYPHFRGHNVYKFLFVIKISSIKLLEIYF